MQNSIRPSWLLLCAVLVGLSSSAAAVTIDWVAVGGAGNAADDTGFGAVPYGYAISATEITNAQYTEFLTAVAATDTNGLYSLDMATAPGGGIVQLGLPGFYSYTLLPGREDMPVNFVSVYDALRFANWVQNGQPTGLQDASTTEDGAYTFSGATSVGGRNPGATIVLPNEDEWYKAAYYDDTLSIYYDYPAGSDVQTTCAAPGATANTANCGSVVGDLTDVGSSSYPGSASPNDTFDQGGNVWEWLETEYVSGAFRAQRGGSFDFVADDLASSVQRLGTPTDQVEFVGFRPALVPEPGTGLLVMAGLLGLARAGRRRA